MSSSNLLERLHLEWHWPASNGTITASWCRAETSIYQNTGTLMSLLWYTCLGSRRKNLWKVLYFSLEKDLKKLVWFVKSMENIFWCKIRSRVSVSMRHTPTLNQGGIKIKIIEFECWVQPFQCFHTLQMWRKVNCRSSVENIQSISRT